MGAREEAREIQRLKRNLDGAPIRTQAATREYREGWERVFGGPPSAPLKSGMGLALLNSYALDVLEDAAVSDPAKCDLCSRAKYRLDVNADAHADESGFVHVCIDRWFDLCPDHWAKVKALFRFADPEIK